MAEPDVSTVKDKDASGTGCAKEEMELNSFLTNSKEDNASSVNTIWAFFYMCVCVCVCVLNFLRKGGETKLTLTYIKKSSENERKIKLLQYKKYFFKLSQEISERKSHH